MPIKSTLEQLWRNWPMKVLAIAAAALLFSYHQIISLEEAVVSVPIEVLVGEDLAVAATHLDSVRVRVRAEEGVAGSISAGDFTARADALDIDTPGTYSIPVTLTRGGAARDVGPIDLTIEPVEIRLVLDERVRNEVAVEPSVQGFPARGFELTRSMVSPDRVTIEGPLRFVQGRSAISTETIDLSGRRENVTARLVLEPPNDFVNVLGGSTVEYFGAVEPTVVVTTVDSVSVELDGLSDQLVVVSAPTFGSVRVQGTLLSVEDLSPDDLRLVADASAVDSAGGHTLQLTPEVPSGFSVLEYSPTSAGIEVEFAENGDEP